MSELRRQYADELAKSIGLDPSPPEEKLEDVVPEEPTESDKAQALDDPESGA